MDKENEERKFSVSENVTDWSKSSKLGKSKRLKSMFVATFVLGLAIIIFLILYLSRWRYEVTTEDAYVSGMGVQVNAQLTGTVSKLMVEDTQKVQRGELLVAFAKEDYQLLYDKAISHLKREVNQFKKLNRSVEQAKLLVNLKSATLLKVKQDYARRAGLVKAGAISKEELAHLSLQATQAQADLAIAKQAYENALTSVSQGAEISSQPNIQEAISEVKEAWLNLQRTEVRAPISGKIARKSIQIGQKVVTGQSMLSVISDQGLWVDANFKESQLRNLRIGQSAEITSDLYGSRVIYHGRVSGVSAGTGSAFALLPAQNASGNWIKIAQRVPVRITLDQNELKQHPLSIGLSMKVKISIKDGSRHLEREPTATVIQAQQELLPVDYQPVEKIIRDILSMR